MHKRLLSVIIPAFNEEDCVDELARRLSDVSETLKDDYEFEFIVIENGSGDGTFAKLLYLSGRDRRFKVLKLTRNFGIEGALTAGLRFACGDAAILMCADLQDPPEMIPVFLAAWEQGFQNVYGIVADRSDESQVRQFLTRGFYWLINRLNRHPVPANASDFRLIDRKLYQTLNAMNERNRMLRAMWAWLGYKSIGIPYDRPPRFGGKSTYRLFSNFVFALHGVASSTTTPLRLIPFMGISLSALTFVAFLALLYRWLTTGVPFSGFGTIVTIVLVLFSVMFLLLGILSEYIGIIYDEVRARPMYVLDESIGFDDASGAYLASRTPVTTA